MRAARLRELLHYDPETGVWRWRVNRDRAGNAKAGDLAGRVNTDGHRRIKVDNKVYFAHRLAFLYMTGEWPKDQVDHKDGDPGNNRWVNLREATHGQNMRNARAPKNNRLGIKGVRRFRGKFRASISVEGRAIHLGTFGTLVDAVWARYVAAKKLHGDFARVK